MEINDERITIDIRSYLFVPQRDDRYHYPLHTMRIQNVTLSIRMPIPKFYFMKQAKFSIQISNVTGENLNHFSNSI